MRRKKKNSSLFKMGSAYSIDYSAKKNRVLSLAALVNYHQLLQGASYEFAEPLVNKMRGNFRFTIDCVS